MYVCDPENIQYFVVVFIELWLNRALIGFDFSNPWFMRNLHFCHLSKDVYKLSFEEFQRRLPYTEERFNTQNSP